MKLQAQGWIRKRRSILRRLEEKTFQTKGGLVSDIHNNELYLIIVPVRKNRPSQKKLFLSEKIVPVRKIVPVQKNRPSLKNCPSPKKLSKSEKIVQV